MGEHSGSITPEYFRKVREVFESALERPKQERSAFIQRMCDDPAKAVEVERMLAAEDQSHDLIDRDQGRSKVGVCTACKSEIDRAHRFCPFCGTPAPGTPAEEGRFRVGALFAGRFRIIGLLGRGGMGEVYRATDLELGQSVALKFLSLHKFDNRARSRLRSEVRLARQISHPNVCRVYDIGETDGELYLPMEYVDGEDLAALLRRIGRVPAAKGAEIARKLCAGLAAAHAKGVLHRDLKPSNIMIDSGGEVRIMDFGLAAVSEQVDRNEIYAGTPAYMAPEQLAGRQVSVQSDLYALGLVLYEMFTGKAPFAGDTISELIRAREQNRIIAPSTLVPDLDAAAGNVILQCLEPESTKRPASALALMASLPGIDLLAEALAAGQTPSPDMVAAAGQTFGISVRTSCVLVAFILVALAALVVTSGHVNVLHRMPFEKPPAVLEQNARDFIQKLGYTDRPVDRAYGFNWDVDYQKYAGQRENRSAFEAQLSEGQPPLVYFWYRQSPNYLETKSIQEPVSEVDPPQDTSGMLSLRLDPQGRLIHFSHVSPTTETTSETPHAPDSTTLFAAVGIDADRFHSTEPQWNPGVTFDSRAAWIGSYDHRSDVSLRVEAAWLRSRLVSFQIFGPWSKPDLQQPPAMQSRTGIGWVVMITLVAFAVLLAWRNLRMGRGDVTGATRLAAVVVCVEMLAWVFTTHYVPTEHEFERIVNAIRSASFDAIVLWALYVGLEPHVRRHWPQSMISWTRIINGRFRDPLVGAHLLIAVAFGLLVALVLLLPRLIGQETQLIPPGSPFALSLFSLLGVPVMFGLFLQTLLHQAALALLFFLLFFAFKVALKRQWLAALLTCALYIASVAGTWAGVQLAALLGALAIFILVRFGVLTMTLAPTITWSILETPLTTDLSAWYSGCTVFIAAVLLTLTAYSFYTTLAGRPLIRTDFLESR
jgi:serine/threonine protein kinase